MRKKVDENQSVLFGVTSFQSLKLLGHIPKRLAEMGFDVHVVADNKSNKVPENLAGIRLHHLRMVRAPSPLADAISLVRWIILIAKIKPALVSIGTPKAALLGIVASWFLRVPIRVYVLRGLRLETTSGALLKVLHLLEVAIAKCSTEIIAVSDSLRKAYCLLGVAPRSKVTVLGPGSSHGVDTNHFNPEKWKNWVPKHPQLLDAVTSGRPIIGFVGRLSIDKGLQSLVTTREMLLQRRIDHEFVAIGTSEAGHSMANQLCVGDRPPIFLGEVRDMAPYYSMLNLLLLPSRREGFPNVVIEAAASGVPSITTNVTGARDSVIDGVTGLISEASNDLAFAEVVLAALQNPAATIRMGRAARRRAIQLFDEPTVTKFHTDFYQQRLAINP